MNSQNDADENESQEAGNPPSPPPVSSENEAVRPEAYEEPSQNNPNITVNLPQNATKPIEWIQLAVSLTLAIIGVIAIWIYGGELKVMQRELSLTRQQMIGTQAAVIPTEGTIGFSFSLPTSSVDFALRNIGHVNASHVTVDFSVRRASLPELRTIGKTFDGTFSEPLLVPTIESVGIRPTIRRVDFAMSKEELELIDNFKQTMEVSGVITYNDGFDDHPKEPFCFRMLTYRIGSQFGDASMRRCDGWSMDYAGAMDNIRRYKETHNGEQQRKK